MRFDLDRLYTLLPAIYRRRDAELAQRLLTESDRSEILALQQRLSTLSDPGSQEADSLRRRLNEKQSGPLKALLAVIAEQIAVLEENLQQVYDDQFIETCAEWVAPYIGDLVGTRNLFVLPDAALSQRAQVANTLSYRRRKGTAAVLEQLARDVTHWDASVVEYFQLLATTQYMKHLRPANLSLADLRNGDGLEHLNLPFDRFAHRVDVRRIQSRRGKYNIPNVGIFLWRLASHPATRSPAFRVDERRYLFNALGIDTPLYNRPETETEIEHLAQPQNVPLPISRRIFNGTPAAYYGVDAQGVVRSILIHRDGQPVVPAEPGPPDASPPPEEISDLITVCDLRDLKDAQGTVIGWGNLPQNKIAIDPQLGRLAFPQNQPPPVSVHVTYRFGFSARMGGGEYGRADTFASGLEPVIKVPSDEPTIEQGLTQLATSGGVVEIENNEYHVETPIIKAASGTEIELRAADEHRPVIVPGGELLITGGANAEVTLNGLLLSGGLLRVPARDDLNRANRLRKLRLQHCTLVPGPSPAINGVPAQPAAPRLLVESPHTIVEIEQCIVGGLRVIDETEVRIANSIVDATAESAVAYAGIVGDEAGAPLEVQNSTIIGKVYTLSMGLASNTIFFARCSEFDLWPAPILAERLQQGCVRFSYLPPGAKVPRRYHCQPQSGEAAARVRPVFNSLRYGDAEYCQLSLHCAVEIRQGADDEAEMGAFHNLYQPQREANLRVRLDEYLRFGLEAGIFYAS